MASEDDDMGSLFDRSQISKDQNYQQEAPPLQPPQSVVAPPATNDSGPPLAAGDAVVSSSIPRQSSVRKKKKKRAGLRIVYGRDAPVPDVSNAWLLCAQDKPGKQKYQEFNAVASDSMENLMWWPVTTSTKYGITQKS